MSPPFRLDNKVALITGAGSGIGQATALLFGRQGARVCGMDLSLDQMKDTVAKGKAEGLEISPYAGDVTKEKAVKDLFDGIKREKGSLDILVNNAGIAHIGSVETTSEEDLDRVYGVNVKGVFFCSKAAVPHMLSQGGGVILNLASIASLIGLKDRFAYGMTKGAVLTMTYSMAVDYMQKNIRVNCVCPNRVHTPFVDGYLKKHYPGKEKEKFEELSKYQPLGRMGRPEEVAALILYLCSDEASFITGGAFPLDGGKLVI